MIGFEVDRQSTALATLACRLAGSRHLISDASRGLAAGGIIEAVRAHDNGPLYEWLVETTAYQGISDQNTLSYMDSHGRVTAHEIRVALSADPSCPKLESYWSFEDCRYHKGSWTCAEPEHFHYCPLPRHDLRKGSLNQTAYSLALFLRDVAAGDFVGWIDDRLAAAIIVDADYHTRRERLRQALLDPLGHIYGIANKLLSMALADLLLAADPDRPLWVEAGAGMIAIDSLVHNWLHRTGILMRLGIGHAYGPKCYGPQGCSSAIEALSATIDARQFNSSYPADFPRFVQRAIWSFCAQAGLDECNGNRIDDRVRCNRQDCGLYGLCGRLPLHQSAARPLVGAE